MKKIFLGCSVLMFSALLAAAVDPGGTWVADVPGARGRSLTHTFVIKMEGNSVSGTASFGRETGPLSNAILEGETVSFNVRYQTVGGSVERSFRGVVHEDTIDFVVTDQSGPVTTTARKVK